MTKNKIKILGIIFTGTMFLSGCLTSGSTPPKSAKEMPVPVKKSVPKKKAVFQYQMPKPAEGSLWTDRSDDLFVDIRARKVGDLVTVRISETPKAQLHAKTDTSRDSSLSASLEFLGYMKALQAKNPNLDRTNLISSSFKPSFVGEGTNDRDGTFTAYVTATVVEVLPSGNFYIRGSRDIRVDNETQYITISGIIRPEDIDTDNEVQSTYIADAKIDYSGKGVIADKQKPGWLMRVMDHLWPF